MNIDQPRAKFLESLRQSHRTLLQMQGIEGYQLRLVKQFHGKEVVVVQKSKKFDKKLPLADGLVTTESGQALGIYVADCCAIYLVETHRRAIGILHSGRRGTEANIVKEGIKKLLEISSGDPIHVVAALSPCIHSCCYDIDFVSEIKRQLQSEGVQTIWRHPHCTGCHLDRYYSYRKEKGKTGPMLAYLMICNDSP